MRQVSLATLGLLLFALATGASAAPLPNDSAEPRDTTDAVADLVVVMKSRRELYLYHHGLVIARYPVALGAAPIGTKHMAGDNKTPIGAYTLDWRNPNSEFHRSLHISYPDATDQAYAARLGVPAGSNIMIHGQPSYDNMLRTGDWTNGCIAVSDAAINDIWARVPDGTPIHIYP